MKLLLHFLLLLLFLSASAQESNGEEGEETKYISSKNFNTIRNQTISGSLTGDKDLSSLSSFLSVNIVKPTITAAVSIPWTRKFSEKVRSGEEQQKVANTKSESETDDGKANVRRIWAITSLNFSGGITDGAATLFQNEKYNTDITLQFEQSFVLFQSYKFLPSHKIKLHEKRNAVSDLGKLEKETLRQLYVKDELLKAKISEAKRKVEACSGICMDEKLALNVLESERNKCLQDILKIDGKSEDEKEKTIAAKTDKAIDEVETAAKWSTVKLLWAGPFYEYNHQKLNFYILSADYAGQLTKETPENHKAGVRFNFLYNQINAAMKGRDFRHFNGFYSLSYSFSKTNNISELTTENIVTSNFMGISGNEIRRQEKSVNAYNALEYDDFNKHQITADINKKVFENLYFHLSYELNFIKDSDKYNGNYQSLGFGAIIAFKDKSDKEKKAFLNIEPFVKFTDLTDKFSEGNDEFYKRAIIGFRTTIPLAHLFQPKQ